MMVEYYSASVIFFTIIQCALFVLQKKALEKHNLVMSSGLSQLRGWRWQIFNRKVAFESVEFERHGCLQSRESEMKDLELYWDLEVRSSQPLSVLTIFFVISLLQVP